MFLSQFLKSLQRQSQFGGVGATRQASRSDDASAMMNNMTAKVGESATLAYEVVYEEI